VLAQRIYHDYRKLQQVKYLPHWDRILKEDTRMWTDALSVAKSGPKVLLATSTGSHPSAPIMDSLLAVALTLRGADVHFLLCDSFLTACQMAEVSLMGPTNFSRHGPQRYFCNGCFQRASDIYDPLKLKVHRYGGFVSQSEYSRAADLSAVTPFKNIGDFTLDGINIGEHAMAGALRYFAVSSLDELSSAEPILRRYLHAAILTMFAVRNLFKQYGFKVICTNHGIYVPHGIVAETGRNEGSRIVAWNVAYRKRSFIFSHSQTYHHTLMSEPVSEWENLTWNESHEQQIVDYLFSRRRGGRDWIVFQDRNSEEDLARISKAVGDIDFSRPCIGMLTNVAWDAQLHYPANAFPNMRDWVIRTIDYFSKRQDLQLVIRIHPAEISGDIPSRQPLMDEIKKAFPILPKNIFIISPQNRINTYAVMEACNAVIIYGTKTGVELTSLGIPVIVAGEAWIRNKGITIDAKSAEHYFQMLDQLPLKERMTADAVQRARKYAYHFFFRRMIPVDQMEPTGAEPQFQVKISSLKDLLPGCSPGLDIICDGIIKGTPFIFPSEKCGVGLK